MIGSTTGRYLLLVLAVLAIAAFGCGKKSSGSKSVTPPVHTCVNMGTATYVGTENVAVTSGACPNYTDLSVTFTIVQTAGSCDFTLQSTRIPGTTSHGTVTDSTITWTGSYPQATGTVTINSATAALTSNLTNLNGNFTWTYAGNTSCTGTTTFHVVKQQ